MRKRLQGVALVVASMSGCSAEVVVIGGENSLGAPPETRQPDNVELVDLEILGEGVLIDGLLYVDAKVDGRRTHVIAEVNDTSITVVDERDDLVGRTTWEHMGSQVFARIAGDDVIDVIDARDPYAPYVVDQRVVDPVPSDFAGVLAANAGHLFFCSGSNDDATLVTLNLAQSDDPARLSNTSACDPRFGITGAASGTMWAQSHPGEGATVSHVSSYLLSPTEVQSTVSFGYSPSGVHQYGRATRVATDGSRMVLDTSSDRWLLVFDDEGQGAPYASFSAPGPKRLLTVHDRHAVFATPDGVRFIDVNDVQNTAMLDDRGAIALDPDATVFIAADPARIVVADAQGRAVIVPRGGVVDVDVAATYRTKE